jgi:hypothetical protein
MRTTSALLSKKTSNLPSGTGGSQCQCLRPTCPAGHTRRCRQSAALHRQGYRSLLRDEPAVLPLRVRAAKLGPVLVRAHECVSSRRFPSTAAMEVGLARARLSSVRMTLLPPPAHTPRTLGRLRSRRCRQATGDASRRCGVSRHCDGNTCVCHVGHSRGRCGWHVWVATEAGRTARTSAEREC